MRKLESHMPIGFRVSRMTLYGAPPTHTQHGLSSDTVARITSDCGAMHSSKRQLALITSGCALLSVKFRPVPAGGAAAAAKAPRLLLLWCGDCQVESHMPTHL